MLAQAELHQATADFAHSDGVDQTVAQAQAVPAVEVDFLNRRKRGHLRAQTTS